MQKQQFEEPKNVSRLTKASDIRKVRILRQEADTLLEIFNCRFNYQFNPLIPSWDESVVSFTHSDHGGEYARFIATVSNVHMAIKQDQIEKVNEMGYEIAGIYPSNDHTTSVHLMKKKADVRNAELQDCVTWQEVRQYTPIWQYRQRITEDEKWYVELPEQDYKMSYYFAWSSNEEYQKWYKTEDGSRKQRMVKMTREALRKADMYVPYH